MYELKKFGKLFTSKFVGTGPSSYKKRIYRAAVLQRLRNTGIKNAIRHEPKEGLNSDIALSISQICHLYDIHVS